ncbi:hypothetical protein BKA70DRAFT_1421002 [Coprinopsis sp. MPI-PUGE-AT-0042]|nr:hypothetical protein BKA70DRAFT_1421002 [Coprinopsis sp. MPI-PUGE-AT-0042]
MSKEASDPARKLYKYIIWAPDCTDAGALDRRYSVREKHLCEIGPFLNKSVKVGGMLVAPGTEGDNGTRRRQAVGSVLIVEAESIDEVEKLVKNDVYWSANVASTLPSLVLAQHSSIPQWDQERLQILPFFAATSFL